MVVVVFRILFYVERGLGGENRFLFKLFFVGWFKFFGVSKFKIILK